MARPPIYCRTFHTCHQNPNISRETVPLRKEFRIFCAEMWTGKKDNEMLIRCFATKFNFLTTVRAVKGLGINYNHRAQCYTDVSIHIQYMYSDRQQQL
jgi:hypothetical protein